MNSLCFAGLLPLLMAAAPDQPEAAKPDEASPRPATFRAKSIPASMPTCG